MRRVARASQTCWRATLESACMALSKPIPNRLIRQNGASHQAWAWACCGMKRTTEPSSPHAAQPGLANGMSAPGAQQTDGTGRQAATHPRAARRPATPGLVTLEFRHF